MRSSNVYPNIYIYIFELAKFIIIIIVVIIIIGIYSEKKKTIIISEQVCHGNACTICVAHDLIYVTYQNLLCCIPLPLS